MGQIFYLTAFIIFVMSWNSQITVTVLSIEPDFVVEDCGFESGAFETGHKI